MKVLFFTIVLCIVNFFSVSSQKVSVNIGLDTLNIDRNQIIKLWTNYLNSDPNTIYNNPLWCENDKLKYKSYDLLKSEGFLQPSIYYFQLENKILSITKAENDFVIKSAFIDKRNYDIYAITNVVATKVNGTFYLTNYQPKLTKNWKTKSIKNITYHYYPEYSFNDKNAENANDFFDKICSIFELKPEKINYFIGQDCDDIYRIKGFDYVLSMGTGNECGFFDSFNNIIYATSKAGENHQHEITHFINNYFPFANTLLLSGLSAYLGGENAHQAKPLLYSIKRVNEYLEIHPEIDLNKPNDFWKLDEYTNPLYVTGALICDIAIEKGGIKLLKCFLNSGKSDEEFLLFIEEELNVKNGELNQILRDKIKKISNEDKFYVKI